MANSQVNECHCAPVIHQSYPAKKNPHSICALFLNLLIAFFPKCPMCWAAYMSVFGGMGMARIPFMGWLFYLFLALLGMHLLLLLKHAPQKGYAPFVLCLCGSLAILGGRLVLTHPWLPNLLGLSLITISAIWSLWINFSKGKTL